MKYLINSITEVKSIKCSFGELFEKITNDQTNFINQIRRNVEMKIFTDWVSCDVANETGEVSYYNVKYNKKTYPVVIVDYYQGRIKFGKKSNWKKLEMTVFL